MNALRRDVRNTFRNAPQSVGVVVIVAVAIALSISMLIARDAVSAKIDAVRSATDNTVTVSPAGFFGGHGGGTPLTATQVTGPLRAAHVTAVQASLTEQLASTLTSLPSPTAVGSLGPRFDSFSESASGSSGTFSVPIRVVSTNSPGNSLVGGTNSGGTEKLTSGSAFSPTSRADVATVGTPLATRNGLTVGSTFANADVVMPLATAQRLAAATDQVTGATVTVNSIGHVADAVTATTRQLGTAADVTSTQATVQSQLAPLNSVKTISTYTLVGVVIGAATLLPLSMLMTVRERRREIRVVKALGATSRSVVSRFIAASTTFTVLGALVGLVVGVARSGTGFTSPTGAAGTGGGLGVRGFGGATDALNQLLASASWSTLVFALLATLVISALGSTVAAGIVTRIRPGDVLRSE